MPTRVRSNADWLVDLRQPGSARDAALTDLRAFLVAGLASTVVGRQRASEAMVEDFAQDALLKILDNLDSFRGDSKFTTWAMAIAVRVAFTELRRRRWRDVSLDHLVEDGGFAPTAVPNGEAAPRERAARRLIIEQLHGLIDGELTDKQRRALVAEVRGLPLEEIARQLGTNRNALYKLLHDARRKLQAGLVESGITADDVRSAFDL